MDAMEHINPDLDIAVIGMSGKFPGADNLEQFWKNLAAGAETLTTFDDEQLKAAGVAEEAIADPHYVKKRGIIENPTGFDAYFFDYTPHEAEIIDPQHRLFMEVAWEALENAGYNAEVTEGLIGLFGGVSMNTYLYRYLAARQQGLSAAEGYQLAIGNDKDFLTTRVSYKFNLRGPSLDVQTACSTSLVSIVLACQNLQNFSCDMALAGGSSVTIPQEQGYLYQEGMILSPDGHCRPFDARARGTVSGNGVGVVLLKRLQDALNDGDTIHALIKGAAYNNDGGQRVGYTAPSVEGQADAIATAQALAGISPADIGYIECHGTGTELGDPIEVAALKQIFTEEEWQPQSIAIGSVKSNIGHLDAAAGIAGFIKSVLALQHKQIPPTVHYQSPNPQIDFSQTPFYVNNRLQDWPVKNGLPRRAAISSFGIGGTNAHVIIQEAPPVESMSSPGPFLLTLSAKTPAALDAQTRRLADHIEAHPEQNPADIAHTLIVGRKAFSQRRFVLAHSAREAVELLRGSDPKRLLGMGHKKDPHPPKTAFLFSGQGSQYALMGKGLYQKYSVYRNAVDECAESLQPHLNRDIRDLILADDKDRETAALHLMQTQYTQPALFVTEYALSRLWESFGVTPQAMAGHSIGEYVAAHLAGVFSLDDALKLVALRGRLMQSLPEGAMLSVPLDEHAVAPYLSGEVVIGAINSKGSTVLSGTGEAISAVAEALKAKGIECRSLHTSHAFHSPMMDPILKEFEQVCAQIPMHKPQIAYLSNVSGDWITAEEATSPSYYARHLRSTVRFNDNLSTLYQDFDGILLEVGPGKTLNSLAARHPSKDLNRVILSSMRHPREEMDDVSFFLTTLGRFWLAGLPLKPETLFEDEKRLRVPLPTYPFEKKPYLLAIPKGGAKVIGSGNNPRQWFYAPYWKRSFENPRAEVSGYLFALGDLPAELKDVFENHRLNLKSYSADDKGENLIFSPDSGEDLAQNFNRLKSALSELSFDSPRHLFLITTQAFKVLPDEKGVPAIAALTALLRSLVVEQAAFSFSWVDSDRQSLERIPALLDGKTFNNKLTALRNGQLFTQEFEHLPAKSDGAFWDNFNQPVILITGGTGNLAALYIDYISQKCSARFYLLSRSGFPEAKTWNAPGALNEAQQRKAEIYARAEKRGSRISFLQADISVEGALEKVWPADLSPDILIHAAGLVGDSIIVPVAGRTDGSAEETFSAKVKGSDHVVKFAREHNVPRVFLQSSLSALLGGYGFGAYGTANAYMDALALSHEQAGLITVNWDGWIFNPGDSGHGIKAEQAPALFDLLFSQTHINQIAVSTENLDERFEKWQYGRAAEEENDAEERTLYDRPNLPTPYVAPRNDLEKEIATVWQQLLGIGQVGIHDDFFDLGGNSLMGTQLISRMRERFKVDVPVKSLFENPTIAGVAVQIEQARSTTEKQEDMLSDMLSKVENMSEEEIKAMLKRNDS
ncbi:MAG TPA: acyltransferase domain-containing protein [Caldithrix abyssi]|uniref:Phenolphthiocerol/phthiocerol polyketide synthase subunit E n=1 Tax=Caldithrix abyssi TaxID=187145 RepID=A0A7V1PUK9_CALAY|nr:acyltransferase domain-containing protein [Caldithrix abyssi]